jgi:predicted TIM-barrel fold metal-dependent hydrolase
VVQEPYIDAHSHIWTPDVGHYPLAEGFQVSDMQPPSFTAQELLGVCRPAGVGRVNLIQMSYYKFDNSYMLDMIKLHPDRFVGTAIVDPLSADPGGRMTALQSKGVRAFRIQPSYGKQPPERWLTPGGYEAQFATSAHTGLCLSCLVDPDGFAEIDRMCRKHPEARVIIDHLGRIGVDGTIRDADVQALCDLAANPRVYVKVSAFYALGKKTPPYLDLVPLVRRVVQAFGSRRCMWGSDCPFQVVAQKYEDGLALVRDHLDFLSPDDRAWMLARTAEQILFPPSTKGS